jgi:hypothetical protein
MKYFISIVFAVVILLFSSCKDDSDLGLSIQPSSDAINFSTDTIHVNSLNMIAPSMSSPSDTFLLGEYRDIQYDANGNKTRGTTYGTTHGEMLAQFTAPLRFTFPKGAQADSMSLTMVFSSWQGSKHSPVQFSAYEMNNPLDYNTAYLTNTNPLNYCSPSTSTLLGQRISVAVPDTVTDTATYQPHLTYKLTNPRKADGLAPAQSFFNAVKNGIFTSQSAFSNFFKGIYIKPTYGNGAIWNVTQLYMQLYYHFHAFVNNKDTTLTNGLVFPASKDVRQISLISHPDSAIVRQNCPDSVTYITSPTGVFTHVQIPVGRLLNKVLNSKDAKGNYLFRDAQGNINKTVNFNHAILKAELTDRDTIHAYVLHRPTTLMLTRISGLNSYFQNYYYSQDTLILAQCDTTRLPYTYSFDLASLLTYRLHKTFNYGKTPIPNSYTEEMAILPICYTTASSSSSTITSIETQSTMSAAAIRSGKNNKSPLRIYLFYNGF